MWKHLKHRNVLTLLGVTIIPLQLISNWMPGGDLSEYIKKHPGAERLGLVGIPVAAFITRLPSFPVVRYRDGSPLPPFL